LNQKLYFICGPTAVGKSSLALRLAKKINGIIINSDSMQVYSNLNVLTARPSIKDYQEVRHELYGYVKGSERYNVAKWSTDILKIIKNNSNPCVIVGGTGMYINSLINGLIDIPSISEIFKKKSLDLLKEEGLDNFIKIINSFDSDALKKISVNDTSRVRRVWEVYNATGITFSDWRKKKNKVFFKNQPYNIYLFTPPREKIYEKVNIRFETMLREGALEEVKKLINLNLDKSLPIMCAHGVPEISNYLNKKYSLDECIDIGQRVTRNYVKRQLTWWRSSNLPICQVFDEFPNEIDENILKI